MKEKIKNKLKPLYKDLLESVSDVDYDLYPFFMQWGESFDTTGKRGILFVGKATNGWVTADRNLDALFDENNENRIFNRDDQIEWVENLSGENEVYNTNKSAFWRVVKEFSIQFFKSNKWYENIAWTNLYKISPEEGNPGGSLKRKQLPICNEILKKEIEILNPRSVIFLTSGWEEEFLNTVIGNASKTKEIEWDGHKTKSIIKDNRNYIISPHPQGKNEDLHVKVLLELTGSRK